VFGPGSKGLIFSHSASLRSLGYGFLGIGFPLTVSGEPPALLNLRRKAIFDFYFNLTVLALFIASLLNLIFRWKERYVNHFQGVVKLNQYIGWLDELALVGPESTDLEQVRAIRTRYQSIVEVLPPNSDSDYHRAKRKMTEARTKASPIIVKEQLFSPSNDNTLLIDLVSSSTTLMAVIRVVSNFPDDLWLGGGAVRNYVWDLLSGRCTKKHDFDIVYFDATSTNEAKEKELEQIIRSLLPRTFTISVKNQARMHLVNGEPPRYSLEEAIANWPEQATSIAVKQMPDGHLGLIAPYGSEDILNMTVRPTPYHEKHRQAFDRRIAEKAWQSQWPEVQIVLPTSSGITPSSSPPGGNRSM
jgi:uncharacterized protein